MDESEPIRVLALLGSPRRDGNTATLLQEVLRGARDEGAVVEEIDITPLHIEPCGEIFDCIENNGICPIQDDMVEIYEKLKQADVVILAAPIMTMGIPAKIKALMDRCQTFWTRKSSLCSDLLGV